MMKKIVNERQKNFIKFFYNAICLILCISQIIFLFSPTILAASSDLRNSKYEVDSDTTDTYQDALINEKNGSRYAGRVWSDKSVFTGNISLDKETDGYDGTITNNSDFLHVFSTLGSSQAYVGLPPSKTIIVIDNSASMYSNSKEWNKTRIAKTIESTNKAIDKLMRTSQYNEIAVVLFGDGELSYYNNELSEKESANTAKVIVPMGHYPISDSQDKPYQYLQGGWNIKSNSSENSESSKISDIPKKPITDSTQSNVNTSSGYMYVDKMYVNTKFNVESSYENKEGIERYDVYRTGTTNIQAGFHVAFQELLKGDKTVKVGGYTFEYLPNIVMLTDGAATDMLQGTYSNPILKDRGFTNDRGTKFASYINVFHESAIKNSSDWNMYMHIINKDGTETFEQVGYGDGTLSVGLKPGTYYGDSWSTKYLNEDPGEEGLKAMKEFAEEIRSTQGTMLLSTLMMVAYEKAVIAKEYGSECDIYTISVDIDNPENYELDPNNEFDPVLKSYNSNAATMNPNKYFNLNWLQEDGFIDEDADLNNLTEEDLAFEPYTVGSELILSLDEAIKAWNEFESGSSSTTSREKLNDYLAYSEEQGLYNDMKDNNVTYNGKEYSATTPIGPNHANAYLVHNEYHNITYDHLKKGDETNNPYDLTDSDLDINYVTKAFYPKSASETTDSIVSVFDEIVQKIKEPAFIPTHGNYSGNDYLKYTDPIGKYMEVKDVQKLLLFGELYDVKKKDTKYVVSNNDKQTELSNKPSNYNYTRQYYELVNKGNDSVVNECYKVIDEKDEFESVVTFNLSDIKIYVDTKMRSDPLENDQTLNVEIPSTALPLQVVTIKLNSDGNGDYYQTNVDDKEESTPLRLFYEVGINDDLLFNNKKDIDLSKISNEYKEKYTKDDILSFNSNYYSNTLYDGYTADTQDDARTKGDALLTLSPSIKNRYYIFQKNLKIYSHAYIIGDNGQVKEESNPLSFEGADFDGEYEGKTENNKPDSTAQEAIKKAFDKGELKKDDIIVLKDDVVKYGTNPSSNDFYYFAIDYFMPTEDDKGKEVQYIVSRKGSEFGSGLLDGGLPKGDFLCWYDESGENQETYDFSASIPENIKSSGTWVLATKIGGLRVGDLHQSISLKSDNKTGTSKSYYLPIIADDLTTKGSDAILDAYLGNNGLLTYKIEKWTIPNTGGKGIAVIILFGSLLIIESITLTIKKYRKKKEV